MRFMTIRKAARELELPEYRLRIRLKENRLPGFYAGVRFMVDIQQLEDMLVRESAQNATPPANA